MSIGFLPLGGGSSRPSDTIEIPIGGPNLAASRGATSAGGSNSPDDCFENVEGLLGIAPSQDEALPSMLSGVGNTVDVLLIDDPLPVHEDVALLEHDLEP